jgi:hypothetical protein
MSASWTEATARRSTRDLPRLASAPDMGGVAARAAASLSPPLRHTYASLHTAKAIEAGRGRDAILTYLRTQLRHRNVQTTMDYYIHLFLGGQREIVNHLDDDTGQDWAPVLRPTRPGDARRLDPAQTVAKPSHSSQNVASGGF